MTDTDMEHHIIRPVILETVTVDTMPLLLSSNLPGIEDIALRKVLQASLPDGQMLKTHIRRSQSTVRDIGVNAVAAHLNAEGLVTAPLPLPSAIHIHGHLPAFCRGQQLPPFLQGNNNLIALAIVVFRIPCPEVSHHLLGPLHHKIQRSNVNGNGHIRIVRVDGRLLILLPVILRQGRMSAASAQQCHKEKQG